MTKKELETENRILKFKLAWLKTCIRSDVNKILEEIQEDEK